MFRQLWFLGFSLSFVLILFPEKMMAGPPGAEFEPGEILVQIQTHWNTEQVKKVVDGKSQIPEFIKSAISPYPVLSTRMLLGEENILTLSDKKKFLGNPVLHIHLDPKADIPEIVKQLNQTAGVILAEPNFRGSLCAIPNDTHYEINQQAVAQLIGLEQAWGKTTGSRNMIVAVLDSGIDNGHPELTGGRVLTGKNFVTSGGSTKDLLGHGTRIAGLIGGRGNNNEGIAGVCWDVSLLPVVIAGVDGKVTADRLIEAIPWAVASGADVINMSLSIGDRSLILQGVCEEASRRALLVAAAGNQGQHYVPVFPAGFESVVGVGAVDLNLQRAPFSNYNQPHVNEFVDLVAPGMELFTTIPGGLYDGSRSSGTSYSTALVSGAAALLFSQYPDQSPAAIKNHLLKTASSQVSRDVATRGLLDAGQALEKPLVPILSVNSMVINDSTKIYVQNDADGALDIGETAEITIDLLNSGASTNAFTGALVSEDNRVAVINNSADFGRMAFLEESRNFKTPFLVSATAGVSKTNSQGPGSSLEAALRLDIPGQDSLRFQIRLEDEQDVPSTISSPQTLTSDKTWIIRNRTVINSGAQLNVQPGATIKFEEEGELICRGQLNSTGTEDQPIQWKEREAAKVEFFRFAYDILVGSSPYGILAEEVTGDRLPDIVTSDGLDNSVSVRAGDGKGGFLPKQSYSTGISPGGLDAADLNGDGVTDLVTANYPGTISVLMGDGSGSFEAKVDYPVGGGAQAVYALDLNGDDHLDLVVANGLEASVSVLANDGSGGFSNRTDYTVGPGPSDILAHDLSGDGIVDIATADFGTDAEAGDTISVLIGKGDGTFEAFIPVEVSPGPARVIAADLNADSHADIITANFGSLDEPENYINILFGQGDGYFEQPLYIEVDLGPTDVLAFDVNGDEMTDLVTANELAGSLSVLPAQSLGEYGPEIRIYNGNFPIRLASADFDGDGVGDLVTSNQQDSTVSYFRGDDSSRYYALYQLDAGRNPFGVAAEDVTRDGVVDLVSAGYSDSKVIIHKGKGNGLFEQWAAFECGLYPVDLLIADVNNDSIKDLVTANSWSSNISIFPGLSGGGFGPEESVPITGFPSTLVSGDFNKDGKIDLIVGSMDYPDPENPVPPFLTYLWGDDSGQLSPEGPSELEHSPWRMTAADVNGDSYPDLITANGGFIFGSSNWKTLNNTVSVFLWNQEGHFNEPIHYPAGDSPEEVAVVDVDEDGNQDLLVADFWNGVIHVLYGLGDGSFMWGDAVGVGGGPTSLATGDFNRDGFMDLVSSDSVDFTASFIFQDGQGSTLPWIYQGAGVDPQRVISADLNIDGIPDLVFANIGDESLTVLIGDGLGGFGRFPRVRSENGSSVLFSHNQMALAGPVFLKGSGSVTESRFEKTGGAGLVVSGNVIVSDVTSVHCHRGFGFGPNAPRPQRVAAIQNNGIGFYGQTLTEAVLEHNSQHGAICLGQIDDSLADNNGGIGLYSMGDVSGSVSNRNQNHGIYAANVEKSVASSNTNTGLVGMESVKNSTAVSNGQGIWSPVVEGCYVVGSFSSALAGAEQVRDSELFENVSISTATIRFNDSILAENGDSATPELVDGMYIAGNRGGGVRGIPVTNSSLVGNNGPGVDQNISVTNSNVVFNEGPGVVGGTINNAFVFGNQGGDLTGGASGTQAFEPVEQAPPFLKSLAIGPPQAVPPPAGVVQKIGIGGWHFTFTFSKPMRQSRLRVTFGQSTPYAEHIVDASPGWVSDRVWIGWYAIGYEVGAGTQTLRIAAAASSDDFDIPPDTYHQFYVDTTTGTLDVANGRVVQSLPGALRLTWDPAHGADVAGYSVLRSGSAEGPFYLVQLLPASQLEFLDSGLSPQTTYYYQVHEYDSNFNSAQLTSPFAGTTSSGEASEKQENMFLYSRFWQESRTSLGIQDPPQNSTDEYFLRINHQDDDLIDLLDILEEMK